jgi:lipopolysaccharide/colanic/teichoic acid biosynthesis glycosyltransferase
LGGACLLAVLFPAVVEAMLWPEYTNLVFNTAAANAIALVAGFSFFRRLTVYPGIQASYFILPIFTVAFASVLAGVVFTRVEYNRSLLLIGYGVTLLWFYLIVLIPEGRRRLRVGVVPFGDVGGLSGVDWQLVKEPDLRRLFTCDLLVADFRSDLPEQWERFLSDATLAGITVLHIKELRESLTGRCQIEHLSENTFGSLVPAQAYIDAKKAIDFVTALAALVVLAPLLLLVALAIRLDSPGPALFRQERIGYRGRAFTVFKFRTMRECQINPRDKISAMTTDGDPRITRVGRILRGTRIDELPQMLNILRGEMSWIGPRPEARVLSEWYEAELPFYRYRHVVRPGITGWAQVNQGHVAEVKDVLGKLQFDFYYIRHFSIWLDALVVVRTVFTVLTGFGAR